MSCHDTNNAPELVGGRYNHIQKKVIAILIPLVIGSLSHVVQFNHPINFSAIEYISI